MKRALESMGDQRYIGQQSLEMQQASFEAAMCPEEMFAKLIEFFPFPIAVWDGDGTAVLMNRAMLDEFNVCSRQSIVGKFNILEAPEAEWASLATVVREIFKGETRSVPHMRLPVEADRQIPAKETDSIYQDVTGFPLLDGEGQVAYAVVLLITKGVYKGKSNIARALDYMENHWRDPYDMNAAAHAAGLSPYHFSRVFKRATGVTPYVHYVRLKMEHLMESLRDSDLPVKDVFEACGLTYTGYLCGVFRKHAGVTPTQYRQMLRK